MKSRTKLTVIVFFLAGLALVVVAVLFTHNGSNQTLPLNTFSFTPISAKRERGGMIVTMAVINRSKSTFVIPFDSVSGPWIEVDSNSGSGWRRFPSGRFAVVFICCRTRKNRGLA